MSETYSFVGPLDWAADTRLDGGRRVAGSMVPHNNGSCPLTLRRPSRVADQVRHPSDRFTALLHSLQVTEYLRVFERLQFHTSRDRCTGVCQLEIRQGVYRVLRSVVVDGACFFWPSGSDALAKVNAQADKL